MLHIKDITRTPTLDEISSFIANPLFDRFYRYMESEYQVLTKIEYSKDTLARGWNVKLRKAGKGLCVIYPKEGYFTVLLVVGRKEKEAAERLLPELSEEMQNIYHQTKEGNGQRWMMIDVKEDGELYQNILKLIRIRRESK